MQLAVARSAATSRTINGKWPTEKSVADNAPCEPACAGRKRGADSGNARLKYMERTTGAQHTQRACWG
eukprot:4425955-Lingulodinium_polyedra.AAC.1